MFWNISFIIFLFSFSVTQQGEIFSHLNTGGLKILQKYFELRHFEPIPEWVICGVNSSFTHYQHLRMLVHLSEIGDFHSDGAESQCSQSEELINSSSSSKTLFIISICSSMCFWQTNLVFSNIFCKLLNSYEMIIVGNLNRCTKNIKQCM